MFCEYSLDSGSAKNKMLFCYIFRKLDFSPIQPLHPSKGGTKVPLPFKNQQTNQPTLDALSRIM